MNWSDIAGVVGKAAPLVGGILGGPLGAAAGGLVAKALGVAESPEAVAEAIQTDPAAALKLAELQISERVRLAELAEQHFAAEAARDIALIGADNSDRSSARQREIELQDGTPQVLAFVVTLGFFGVVGAAMIWGLPEHGQDALLILLGALSGAWTAVMSYYFGSSAGSRQKTEILSRKP